MPKEPRSATRPGGRSARIRDAVFAATLRLLERDGVAGVSVREIAAESGAAETTIYRRWGSLTGLIAAALADYAVTENPLPDTGSLEGDLTQLLRNVVQIIERPEVRSIFRFTMSLDDGDEELSIARSQFWRVRFDAGASVVLHAVERKEISPLTDPQLVIETLVGTAYVRSFLLERPLTEGVIEEAVKAALLVAGRETT
jgi:AcrR family transcriptional regulator